MEFCKTIMRTPCLAHKDQADGAAGDDDEEADDGEAFGLGRIAVANIKTEELGEIVISAIKLKRTLPEWALYMRF